ncbi:sugar kinase [Aurantiacibacter sp. MUD61]|uniref:sugar kinase n=1 Tax=Aurantiacibacter sp. MUD61 TaxID=3009083 RepID=UPI0022F01D03|nr:sugar kinase [Aurantiacibacter sp. MUD61]
MTVFIFGEAMLEYHSRGNNGLRYGGDTLNTAIHLARRGHDVAYVTAVGTDPISDALVDAWAREGIDTQFVLRHPNRSPGIYAIHLDGAGERSFLYWRERSAAREMFALPKIEEALAAAKRAEVIYFSLISLAIIGEEGRSTLLNTAYEAKARGCEIVYDSNFRPQLWDSEQKARLASEKAIKCTTLGLPTNVDEQQIYDDKRSEWEIARAWLDGGCSRVAVKAGENGCYYAEKAGTAHQFRAEPVTVIDSSGAGDAFNAGFLSAMLRGLDEARCVAEGQSLARETLQQFGAVQFQSKLR